MREELEAELGYAGGTEFRYLMVATHKETGNEIEGNEKSADLLDRRRPGSTLMKPLQPVTKLPATQGKPACSPHAGSAPTSTPRTPAPSTGKQDHDSALNAGPGSSPASTTTPWQSQSTPTPHRSQPRNRNSQRSSPTARPTQRTQRGTESNYGTEETEPEKTTHRKQTQPTRSSPPTGAEPATPNHHQTKTTNPQKAATAHHRSKEKTMTGDSPEQLPAVNPIKITAKGIIVHRPERLHR
jgi:hypothetical protein